MVAYCVLNIEIDLDFEERWIKTMQRSEGEEKLLLITGPPKVKKEIVKN